MERDNWIKLEKPAPEGELLVLLEDGSMHTASFGRATTYVGGRFHFDMPKVLYYMPLPHVPKGFNRE